MELPRASGCSKIDGCRIRPGARWDSSKLERRSRLPGSSTRPPERRMTALRQANEVRGRRAELKRQLREGAVRLEEVIAAPADYLATAEVFDLLVAAPKIGPAKAARLLTRARVSQSKTICQLSERQRGRLIELLDSQHRATV